MVFILACSISCRHLFCGFYSTHLRLKALPNIYHVPFLAMHLLLQAVSALLSYVSPSSPSSLPSCRSYLSVSRSSPPPVYCFCWVAPSASGTTASSWLPEAGHQFTQHHLFCTYILSCSPSWNEHWVRRVSAGAIKLSMSRCVFLASEKAVGNKREGKSSQEIKEVFPGEVWKEIGSQ